jgi:hypothetical protein
MRFSDYIERKIQTYLFPKRAEKQGLEGMLISLKASELVKKKGATYYFVLGEGSFPYEPAIAHPVLRDYGAPGHPRQGALLLMQMASDLLPYMRTQKGKVLYTSYTSIGHPCFESEDVLLLGLIQGRLSRHCLYSGDYIRGFTRDRRCVFEKIFHAQRITKQALTSAMRECLLEREAREVLTGDNTDTPQTASIAPGLDDIR